MDTRNTDIIIVAPEDVDYPPFRTFLKQIHGHFNRIIWVFSNNEKDPEHNYSGFISEDLDFVDFYKLKPGVIESDWCTDATLAGLKNSNSEYVLFMDPDFLINPEDLLNLPDGYDIISFYTAGPEPHDTRIWGETFMHVKRSLIERTSKDFSCIGEESMDDSMRLYIPNADETIIDKDLLQNGLILHEFKSVDHFDRFCFELVPMTHKIFFLNENNVPHFHIQGGSNNFRRIRAGSYDNVHRPQIYYDWLKKAIDDQENVDGRFLCYFTGLDKWINKRDEKFNKEEENLDSRIDLNY
jgi:glycosyltransferase involved in cell wall biosynthesis